MSEDIIPTEEQKKLAAGIHVNASLGIPSTESAQLIAESEVQAVAGYRLSREIAIAECQELRIEIEELRNKWVSPELYDQVIEEFHQLRAEVALLKAAQKISDDTDEQAVKEVISLRAEVERQTKRADECAAIALAYAPKYEQVAARAERAEAELRHVWALFPEIPGKTVAEATEEWVAKLRYRAERAEAKVRELEESAIFTAKNTTELVDKLAAKQQTINRLLDEGSDITLRAELAAEREKTKTLCAAIRSVLPQPPYHPDLEPEWVYLERILVGMGWKGSEMKSDGENQKDNQP